MGRLASAARFETLGEASLFSFILLFSLGLFLFLEVRFFLLRRRSGDLKGFFTEEVRDELAWAAIPALVLLALIVS